MGRTVTPKYRVEVETERNAVRVQPFCWSGHVDGRANAANLAKFVDGYNASFQPGGVNQHVGPGATIVHATPVRQADDEVIAEWRAE